MRDRDHSSGFGRTARWLGRAGLLPFLLGPALIAVDASRADRYVQGLGVYALCIVSFLLGSWWGLALIRRYPRILVVSNFLVVVAFTGWFALGAQHALLLLAALLGIIVVIERRHVMFVRQPVYYRSLRATLTTVASAGLCLAWLLGHA